MQEKIQLTNQRYRLGYHISAPSGWINDPNGFCYYKGYYHIFYQHYPYSAEWGPMHWGHARSKDLVHWETLPIAIAPDTPQDEDGCFSGSAIVKDDILYLVYTGHHYYGDGDNDHFWQNQNIAYSTDGIHFKKYEHNPIIAHEPTDNTHHFRDPKVWEEDGIYYIVLGSQGKNGLGRTITYRSKDLFDWEYLGSMTNAKSLNEEGFMWECPDFFTLNNGNSEKNVLLLSPQGVQTQKDKYMNLFQTGYFIGDYDCERNIFSHGAFKEIDFGHDFYATQTMLAPDGRRLVFGWMAMWESDFPEKKDGWAGALTIPRELTLKNDILHMYPVKEVELLRTKELAIWEKDISIEHLICEGEKHADILLKLGKSTSFDLSLMTTDDETTMRISYDIAQNTIHLFRQGEDANRYATVSEHEIIEIRLLLDTTSLEVFFNQGELTFTERFYLKEAPKLTFMPKEMVTLRTQVYQLEHNAVCYEEVTGENR